MTDMQKLVTEIDAGLSAPPVRGSASHQQIMSDQAHARLLRHHWPTIRAALSRPAGVAEGYVLAVRDDLSAQLASIARKLDTYVAIYSGDKEARRMADWCRGRAARMAAAPPPPAQGWQPIETAPKDGTQFLASIDGQVRRVSWCKTSHVPIYGWNLLDQGSEDCELCKPTHWMPLPTLPAVEGE